MKRPAFLTTIAEKVNTKLDALNQRTSRERAMVLILLLLIILLGWTFLASKPMTQKMVKYRQDISRLQSDAQRLEQQAELIFLTAQSDPDAPMRADLSQLQQKSLELNQKIREAMSFMVEPTTMANLLHDLLRQQQGLKLIRLESIPATPFHPAEQEVAADALRAYRHGIRIEVEGAYFDLLTYLQTVEALPWYFFWEILEYQVITHPNARIYLEVYTIGTEQKWIGV
ncbi:hypothetical protein [Chrysiogenes arsenatis]|uniref:hypothetical protein n=1 Tax=Chrysiogenes arsenatis TaxID=309797 RepID=UPI00040DF46B|nr:hypothetical protein [Chrysiogenes arsenatis]